MFLLVLSNNNHLTWNYPAATATPKWNRTHTSRLPRLTTMKTFNKLAGRLNSIRRKNTTKQPTYTYIYENLLGKPMASKFDGPNKMRRTARPNFEASCKKTVVAHIKISFLSTDAKRLPSRTYRPNIAIVWYIAVISFPFRIYSQFRNRFHHIHTHTNTCCPYTHETHQFFSHRYTYFRPSRYGEYNLMLCLFLYVKGNGASKATLGPIGSN